MARTVIINNYYLNFLLILLLSSSNFLNSDQQQDQFDNTCQLPEIVNGRVISLSDKNTALLKNANDTFVLPGTEVFIFCNQSFRLIVTDDSPLVCLSDGKWSRDAGKCAKVVSANEEATVRAIPSTANDGVECSVPMVRNGDVFAVLPGGRRQLADHPFNSGDTAPAGMRIRVICNEGFQLPSESFAEAICLRQGNQWTNPIGPCNTWKQRNSNHLVDKMGIDHKALSGYCGPEPEIVNGEIAPGTREIGARRRVVCFRGFTLLGLGVIECASGTWSRPGTCRPASSRSPANNGNFVFADDRKGGNFYQGSQTKPLEWPPNSNPPSFALSPPRQPSQIWSNCVADPYVPSGQATRGGTLPGDIRRISCNPGYVLQGADSIVCSQSGHWSIPGSCVPLTQGVPQQTPADCGPPPVVKFGNLIDDFPYYSGSTRRKKIRCQRGFEIVGPETIFCDFGRWSTPGACFPNDSDFLFRSPASECLMVAQFVRNGRISKIQGPDGQFTQKLTCDKGYSVMASDDVICDLETGRWKAMGYCLKDEYAEKLKQMRQRSGSDCLATDDDRVYFGYSWDRTPLLSDDSGCFNKKNQVGTDGSFWSLHYPCPYENRLTCVWDIVAPEGEYVAVAFNDIFYIEPGVNGSSDCQHDSLSFYVEAAAPNQAKEGDKNYNDSSSGSSTLYFELAGKFCGEKRPKNMILQSSNVRVVFKTDNRYNGYGFRLVWASIRPNRLQQIFDGFVLK